MDEFTLTSTPADRVVRRRTRRDPKPRFLEDRSQQLDAVRGCPDAVVAKTHLSRAVLHEVSRLDLGAVEARYSSLGRHGFAPRSLLSLWVYASLIGVHHASKLAKLVETDAACQLLTGGHRVSRSKLSEFRAQHGPLFAFAIEETVRIAVAQGLLPLDELAIDSMRLRAHASTKAVRTVDRSTKRLAELEATDMAKLDEVERAHHEAKLKKHRSALAECAGKKRPNIVLTNASAALMKFPSGAGLPGHRVTVTAAGVKERFVVAVLVDADTNDYGKLEPMLELTRRQLTNAGVDPKAPMQAAADAGYCSGSDLAAAQRFRAEGIDVLVDGCERDEPSNGEGLFGRERFTIREDGSVLCPAGKPMVGASGGTSGRQYFRGDGCPNCPLKSECTSGERRKFSYDATFERGRAAMLARMAQPGARARYGQRIATVEPVFSSIEDGMAFRRASSRHAQSVVAEVLLKVLAHNLRRLVAARALRLVFIPLEEFLETL